MKLKRYICSLLLLAAAFSVANSINAALFNAKSGWPRAGTRPTKRRSPSGIRARQELRRLIVEIQTLAHQIRAGVQPGKRPNLFAQLVEQLADPTFEYTDLLPKKIQLTPDSGIFSEMNIREFLKRVLRNRRGFREFIRQKLVKSGRRDIGVNEIINEIIKTLDTLTTEHPKLGLS